MGALVDKFKAVGNALKVTLEDLPDGEEERRLAICGECPKFNKGDLGFSRCEVCGCFMVIKAKLAQASCPIEKW